MQYWSWLLTVVGVLGMYLAGKNKWGWAVGLMAQFLWLTYALVTHQYGFIIASFAYGSVYVNNFIKWHKEEQTLGNND